MNPENSTDKVKQEIKNEDIDDEFNEVEPEYVYCNQGDPEVRQPIDRTEEKVQYQCNKCPYTTYIVSNFKRHGLVHSKDGRAIYRCNQCPLTTFHKDNMVKHIKTVHSSNGSKFPCRHCTKVFKGRLALNDHILKNHPKFAYSLSSNIYTCDRCDFKTMRKFHLTRHLIKHKNDATYICKVCGNRSYEKSNHKEHLKTHLMEKHSCKYCNIGFPRKQCHDEHLIRHHCTDDSLMNRITHKIHQCPHCPYKTVKSSGMMRHIKSH